MPNQPKTPNRTLRIPDEIYLPAKAKARSEGRTLSDVIREKLTEYVYEDEDL